VPLYGPFGKDQPVGDRAVGQAVGDESSYLPFPPGQRVGGPDGLLEPADEAFGAGGRAGHVQAACFGCGLPGEFPGLRQVIAGRASGQRGGPVQPGHDDEWPGAEPGVHRQGRGEVVQRLLRSAEQRRQPAQRPVHRALQGHQP
jgi:hypothetical protein